MKTHNLFKVVALLVIPVIFYFVFQGFSSNTKTGNSIAPPPAGTGGKDFENVIFNYDSIEVPTTGQWIPEQISQYKAPNLNFTGVQSYEFESDNFGYFNVDLTGQQILNIAGLNDIVTSNNLDFYFHRPKISNLCYGQRVVFEVTPPPGNNNTNDGFCFSSTGGIYTQDQGRTVLHTGLPDEQHPDGYWLAKNIYENKTFSAFIDFGHGAKGTWYIKPMMRIPVNTNPDAPVVRIDVHNYNDNNGTSVPIESITLRAMNFNVDAGNTYNGEYVDVFRFLGAPGTDSLTVEGGDGSAHTPPQLHDGCPMWSKDPVCGYLRPAHTNCHVDFQIYWLGQVECWFEKMTVDEATANKLFSPSPNNFDGLIENEVTNTGRDGFTYYVDEISTSNAPCINYVKDKMHYYNPNANLKLLCATNYAWDVLSSRQETLFSKHYLETIQPPTIELNMVDMFEIFPGNLPESVFTNYDDRIPNIWFGSRANYTSYVQNYVFGDRNSRTPSDQWDYTNWYIPSPAGSDVYDIEQEQQQIKTYSPNTKLMAQGQMHAYMHIDHNTGKFDGMSREPLNEEIGAQVGIFLAHGVQSLCWFIYQSKEWVSPWPYTKNMHYAPDIPNLDISACYGLTAVNDPGKRITNCYNQPKWDFISQLNAKILTWKPTLEKCSWLDGWSIHSEPAPHRYILGMKSIDVNSTNPNPCYIDGERIDCPDDCYWEMGFYDPPANEPENKYFVMANRRCIPVTNLYAGDVRRLKLRFDPTQLTGPRNWVLTDIAAGNSIVFDKDDQGWDYSLDLMALGTFQPGECKLFKLSPAMISGGTLVADENISGETFTCAGNIYNNGHNITIGSNTHISFSDTGRIVMTGGSFTVSTPNLSGQSNITFGSAAGSNWHGLSFNNSEVKIYNAAFNKTANDTISAINMIDCPFVDIRGNAFSTGDNTLQGCINAVYYNAISNLNQNFYIGGNTFNSNASTVPALSVSDYAGITMPVLIENNNFNSTSTGTTAILLSGVTTGAVKNNNITDYSIGLNLLSTSADVYNNTISSSLNGATGIYGTAGTELNMNASGEVILGGLNNILLTGNGSRDMLVENSFFDIDNGQNIFELSEASASSHLTGYFPYSLEGYRPDARDNCFKVNGSMYAPPVNDVRNGTEGEQISFTFEPYLTGCSQEDAFAEYVINLGNGIYDTLGLLGSGNGGSKSSVATELRSVKSTAGQRYIFDFHKTYDSICVAMRKHNYAYAKSRCINMIDMFTDSLELLGAISKLYLAVIASDTTQAAISNLKTYYETLILNHSSNISLVKRCNYFVQKCKVKLHQYSSAMSGFNEIINQNPYSYEGLLARWDYMATSLLISGQGGGENNDPLLMKEGTKGWFEEEYEPDGDKSPFTKEERTAIRQNVSTALITGERREREKIKILEERSNNGDEKAKQELKIAKTLKEIVKTEKPKNIIEHIRIVSGDVQKIFGSGGKTISKIQNNIPQVFKLYQNYPNPFNPVCVIKYDLPKDVKTVIKIYDILGREVRTLVNEFKKAGAYTVNFDGSVYASGVYFYRIDAGDYVESKKMVLVK